ncbi:MAG: helix-turn-helix transcriptional regulator [Lachnospiraceae bacterium]|nr:helix-turn-helix transcriptional regulator [Lachnospiraceae bacterium]
MKKINTKDNWNNGAPKVFNVIDTVEDPVTKDYVRLLYDQLTRFCQECACTSAEMSKKLNKSSGYFSKIESRKAFPSMETFLDFCTVCKIHPKEFFDADFEYSYQARIAGDKLSLLTSEQLRIVTELIDQFIELNGQTTEQK